MLEVLSFRLPGATGLDYLQLFFAAARSTSPTQHLAQYLLERWMLHPCSRLVCPRTAAMAALSLAHTQGRSSAAMSVHPSLASLCCEGGDASKPPADYVPTCLSMLLMYAKAEPRTPR